MGQTKFSVATGVQPILDLSLPGTQLVPLEDWWKQSRLIFTYEGGQPITFTRKDFLLTLANKEGGAHVDTAIPPSYEKYVVDSPLKFAVNGVMTDTVHLARYSAAHSAVQMIDCLERNFPFVK